MSISLVSVVGQDLLCVRFSRSVDKGHGLLPPFGIIY